MSELRPGEIFADRFLIEHMAGVGGMGAVYRTRDATNGRTVALKVLHREVTEEEDSLRFLREAKILDQLQHPGIARYIAHGISPSGQAYLAMEWLDGETLAHRLARSGLTLLESLHCLRAITSALAEAHGRGIVHRDLKPANIFLRDRESDRVVVLDFGVARRYGLSQAVTRTGMVVGTPDYMSPEQAQGSRAITPAADIFSLGTILFECLIGTPPFVGEHVAAVLAKILFGTAQDVRELRPELPSSVAVLAASMLARKADERPQDARVLLTRIDQVLQKHLADLHPPSTNSPLPHKLQSGGEQGLVTVLLCSVDSDLAIQATQAASDETQQSAPLDALVQALSALGAQLAPLADGSLVVTFSEQLETAGDRIRQAVRCGLIIREHWPAARVSLATGRGALDSPIPIGEALDRAAGLLKAGPKNAPSGRLLLDEVSAGLLDSRFHIGRDASGVHVLDRVDLEADDTRLLLGKPTPCVGRESDLAALDALLQGVIEESNARAVIVTAPPGVGKSRLRHEFLRRVYGRSEPVQILLGRCDPLSIGVPFGVIAQILRKRCGVVQGDASSVVQARLSELAESLPGLDNGLNKELLGELLGAQFSDEKRPLLRSARLDGQVMGEQLQRAFVAWLRSECAVRPVLLVLEDLHWSDTMTVKGVDSALRALPDLPLCVLGLARPEVTERFPTLWTTYAQPLPLRPLHKRACERLAAQVLGARCTPQMLSTIVENSEGNALFLEELIRSAAEDEAGHRPSTVLALLQNRISRLDPHDRRVLRMASVLGENFTLSGVRALLGQLGHSDDSEARLKYLARSELIIGDRAKQTQKPAPDIANEIPAQRDCAFHFRHALLRDAAYELLSTEESRLAHRRAAEFLEREGQNEPIVLAEHLLRSETPSAAVPHLLRAAHHATTQSSPNESLRLVDLALSAGAQGQARGELLAVRGMAAYFAEDNATAISASREAWNILPPNSRYWYLALDSAGVAAGSTGDFPTLFEVITLFESGEPGPEVSIGFGEAAAVIGSMYGYMGLRDRLEQLVARCAEYRRKYGDQEMSPRARAALNNPTFTFNHSFAPHPFTALAASTEALRLASLAGQLDMVPIFNGQQGLALMEVGRFAEGVEIHQRMIGMARARKDGWSETLVAYFGAAGLVRTDDPSLMPTLEEQTRIVIDNPKAPFVWKSTALGALSHVRLIQGDLDQALRIAREATDQLMAVPTASASPMTTLSRVQLRMGDAAAAQKSAEQGLQALVTLGAYGCNELPLRAARMSAYHALGEAFRDELRAEAETALKSLNARLSEAPDDAARVRFLALPAHAEIVRLCALDATLAPQLPKRVD